MVMDLFHGVVPKFSDSIYVLDKVVDSEGGYRLTTTLGIFDLLETALHALDVVSKFRADGMKDEDSFVVSRLSKNTLKPSKTRLAAWQGSIELAPGLRTHDVEQ